MTDTGKMADEKDKAVRYGRLSALLDEWANDKSGFDARVEPVISKALKDSCPRHFPPRTGREVLED